MFGETLLNLHRDFMEGKLANGPISDRRESCQKPPNSPIDLLDFGSIFLLKES